MHLAKSRWMKQNPATPHENPRYALASIRVSFGKQVAKTMSTYPFMCSFPLLLHYVITKSTNVTDMTDGRTSCL